MDDNLELYKLVYRIAGETAGLLRDLSCRSEYTLTLRGDTIKADVEAESYAYQALKAEGIGGKLITEESGVLDLGGDGPVFILDPLDGSTNYKLCIPWSSVSLAVAPPGARSIRQVIAGVVVPVFHGIPTGFAKGHGCMRGLSRVEVRREAPRIIMVYVDHPDAPPHFVRILKRLRNHVGERIRVRSLGSAALELAMAALGDIMAFIDIRSVLRNVDVAAALGMLLECGGEAYGLDGKPVDTGLGGVEFTGPLIASYNPDIALMISEWTREYSPDQ